MKKYAILIICLLCLGCAHSVIKAGGDSVDFSPKTLTDRSWAALEHQDYKSVNLYTAQCIGLYAEAAKAINATDFASEQERMKEYGLLNYVGQCFIIRGEAFFQNEEYEKAKENYESIINYYYKSEVQDQYPWKPAEFARQRILEIDKKFGGSKTAEKYPRNFVQPPKQDLQDQRPQN